jgi:hypothetical protein
MVINNAMDYNSAQVNIKVYTNSVSIIDVPLYIIERRIFFLNSPRLTDNYDSPIQPPNKNNCPPLT